MPSKKNPTNVTWRAAARILQSEKLFQKEQSELKDCRSTERKPRKQNRNNKPRRAEGKTDMHNERKKETKKGLKMEMTE